MIDASSNGGRLRRLKRKTWPALLGGALLGTAVLMPAVTAPAKTPGRTYCFVSTCHRVKTIEETRALVGKTIPMQASFYDDAGKDRYNPSNMTSSGEYFRSGKPDNAASPIFPDGTKLLVWHPGSKRAIVVRVNNAGPYWGARRLIDLSRAGAERLGFKHAGVASVHVKVLEAPTRAEATYRRGRTYEPVPGYLGAFASIDDALQDAGQRLALDFQGRATIQVASAAEALARFAVYFTPPADHDAGDTVTATASAAAELEAPTEIKEDAPVTLLASLAPVGLPAAAVAVAAASAPKLPATAVQVASRPSVTTKAGTGRPEKAVEVAAAARLRQARVEKVAAKAMEKPAKAGTQIRIAQKLERSPAGSPRPASRKPQPGTDEAPSSSAVKAARIAEAAAPKPVTQPAAVRIPQNVEPVLDRRSWFRSALNHN